MKLNIYTTLFLLFAALFFTACNSPEDIYAPKTPLKSLDKNITIEYQIYTEKRLAHRANNYQLYESVKDKSVLDGADLDSLHRMLVDYTDTKIEKEMYKNEYEYLMYSLQEYSQEDTYKLIMISLSAKLISYDDYILVYAHYYEDDKLRSLLNKPESAYGIQEYTLNTIYDDYTSSSDVDAVESMIEYYNRYIQNYNVEGDAYYAYLKQLIEDSPSYQLGFDDISSASSILDEIYNSIIDTRNEILSFFFSSLSENIGNTAGLVETREGKLYGNDVVAQELKLTLQPGDILLEKTPFRLTDKLIPGYWGHIAVYIGTETQLRNLGIWDDINSSVQAEISAGKVIEEALRDGVQLNSVEHFLNIDDLAVMQNDTETQLELKSRILLTLKQLGKEYDFEYDVENSDKIICSELVYITYLSVDWQTESLAGINTISPDNVAVKSVESGTVFSLPILYVDGVEMTENRVEVMQALLDSVKD